MTGQAHQTSSAPQRGRNLAPLIETERCFTDEECARIIAEGMALPMRPGEISGRGVAASARNSTIALFPSEQRYAWMIERIARVIADLNPRLWGFEIVRSERLQFTAYGVGQYYDWHMDLGPTGPFALRKISVSVPLNDPGDYEGGQFEINLGTPNNPISQKKGAAILFPSYVLHRVLPVTRGIRYALVAWLGGTAPFL